MIKVLTHQGKIGGEVRPLYFYKAMGREICNARIISFGACNFRCLYCKRDGAFVTKEGDIISSIEASEQDLLKVCDDAVAKEQILRISGGDPVMFPDVSMRIAEYVFETYGKKLSIAHNGSSPALIRKLLPFLESAAIDLKAPMSEMGTRAGLDQKLGEKMYQRSLQVQDALSDTGVLVDVRTPIFSTSTLDDMLQLAEDIIRGGNNENEFWTWRMYSPVRGCDWLPPKKEAVVWMIEEVKKLYPELKIGLRAKWEPNGFLYF